MTRTSGQGVRAEEDQEDIFRSSRRRRGHFRPLTIQTPYLISDSPCENLTAIQVWKVFHLYCTLEFIQQAPG